MTTAQARKILADLSHNVFYHMGISEQKPHELKHSLEEMLQANKIVAKCNQKAAKKQALKGGSRTIQVTVDNRLIAAMYVAANYQEQSHSIAYANGNYIFVTR